MFDLSFLGWWPSLQEKMLTSFFAVVVQEQSLILCLSCFLVLNEGLFLCLWFVHQKVALPMMTHFFVWKTRLRCYSDSMSPYSWVPFVFSMGFFAEGIMREFYTRCCVSERQLSSLHRCFWIQYVNMVVRIIFTALCMCTLCSACWTRMQDNPAQIWVWVPLDYVVVTIIFTSMSLLWCTLSHGPW